jgi:M6 family metalloprotease-like protein
MRKILAFATVFLASLLLASCSNSSSSSSLVTSGYYKASVNSYSLINHPSLDNFQQKGMPSTGNVKVLVIPVCFSGENDPSFSDEEKSNLEKAYFGNARDTTWESLSSYYKKSSYGKLNISGTITGAYKDPMSSQEFETLCKTKDGFSPLVDSGVNYVTSTLGIKSSDYDSNKDGFIDVVDVIYVTGQKILSQGGTDFWWARTGKSSTNLVGNVDSPVPSRYFWAPYLMICPGFYGGSSIDTHVLVHETGHAQGLSDYYSYAAGDNAVCPLGGIDMMDFNIGDHNAYSKMILGWVNPFVVDGSAKSFTMTLHSFTDTGECVILRDTKTDPWNGLPYDEYLLLQYYTPTGLNEKDSLGYPEWSGRLGHDGTYQSYGLQLFHVDARLYKTIMPLSDPTGLSGYTSEYTDDIIDSQINDSAAGTVTFPSNIAANNTIIFSYDVENKQIGSPNCLIASVPASGTTAFMSKDYKKSAGLMSTLFGIGEEYGSDTFSMEKYAANMTNGTKFDDGSTLNYSFKVVSNGPAACSISFSMVS